MTIFVAGMHGAGKTFIAKPASEKLGARYATASQLIREERGLPAWTPSRIVSEVEQNQRALISAVQRILSDGRDLILDGHFVLRRAPGVHERLPVSVFRDLQCTCAILLTAPTEVLIDRLRARGDETWSLEEVAAFDNEELQHGRDVTRVLGIPLFVLNSPDILTFEAMLQANMVR